MKNILRVLVPVDFSKESELATNWGETVARGKPGATIYLLHVLPLREKPEQLGAASTGYGMELQSIKVRMKNLQDQIKSDVLVMPLYEVGRTPEVIAKVCEEKRIDLVVMTTRGRRGLTHILEGSTTEETVRLAPCPVLVLHLNEKTQSQTGAETARAV